MAVFQVQAANVTPGAVRSSPPAGVDPPEQVTALKIQLTDPNGVWDTTTGNIIRWGVQTSRADGTFANDGSDWGNEGSTFQDNIPFGQRSRSGSLPTLSLSRTDVDGNPVPVAPPGIKLRLAIQVDHAIVLGATVSTNTDAAV
jgi:hypothetical protein